MHERRLAGVGGRLGRGLLDRAIERRGDRLSAVAARFDPTLGRRLDRDAERLKALSRALATLRKVGVEVLRDHVTISDVSALDAFAKPSRRTAPDSD